MGAASTQQVQGKFETVAWFAGPSGVFYYEGAHIEIAIANVNQL